MVCDTRPMFKTVLDACVLYPSTQRDFLLQLAAEGAYAPLWSSGIITELDRVMERRHQAGKDDKATPAYRNHLIGSMTKYFPGSTINAIREREYYYDIDDPNDGHVVHAAIMGKADVIVTSDKKAKMERSAALVEASIDVLPAHVFAANTVSAHPEAGVRAVMQISGRQKNPPRSPDEILGWLADTHDMTEVAEILLPRLAD